MTKETEQNDLIKIITDMLSAADKKTVKLTYIFLSAIIAKKLSRQK